MVPGPAGATFLAKEQGNGGRTELGTQEEKRVSHRKILSSTLDILSFIENKRSSVNGKNCWCGE